jgi:hypothetical protein
MEDYLGFDSPTKELVLAFNAMSDFEEDVKYEFL